MIVSNCCGAKLHDLETKICMCCNEHADIMVMVDEKEYNWSAYQNDVITKYRNKYGSIFKAVVEMDAKIASLQVEADSLRELIDWDDEE